MTVVYEVWLRDDRGALGGLRRLGDGTWDVKPSWLTGWFPGHTTEWLGRLAKAAQQEAADYWDDGYDQRRVANEYYIARWWHTAYIFALEWERGFL